MIRGAVYRVDLGEAKRGHEQRGRRFGVVLSPSGSWSVATIVPTSTSANPTAFRPELKLGETLTCFLADQIRTIDTKYIQGDPEFYLEREELAQVEAAVARYLGVLATV